MKKVFAEFRFIGSGEIPWIVNKNRNKTLYSHLLKIFKVFGRKKTFRSGS